VEARRHAELNGGGGRVDARWCGSGASSSLAQQCPAEVLPSPFAGASSRRLAVVRAELAGAAVATSAPRFHIELVIDGLFLSVS
jgi:hypothetical protein